MQPQKFTCLLASLTFEVVVYTLIGIGMFVLDDFNLHTIRRFITDACKSEIYICVRQKLQLRYREMFDIPEPQLMMLTRYLTISGLYI